MKNIEIVDNFLQNIQKKLGRNNLSIRCNEHGDYKDIKTVSEFPIHNFTSSGGCYIIDEGPVMLGYFYISEMPHCCGLGVISCVTVLYNQERNKGFAKEMIEFAKTILKHLGYSAAICTSIKELNGHASLVKNWKPIHVFKNNRTFNDITISIINL